MLQTMRTTIIIYTFNNEETIFNVVASCCKNNPDGEIIVVDDASTDKTESQLEILAYHHSFKYLKLLKRKGIGECITEGVICSTGEIILLCDAKQGALNKSIFERAIQPVEDQACDMLVTLPPVSIMNYDVTPFFSTLKTRTVFRRDLMSLITDIKEMRHNIDLFIDLYFQLEGRRVKVITMEEPGKTGNYKINTAAKNSLAQQEDKMQMSSLCLFDMELVLKRLKNRIVENNNYAGFTISSVQFELNNKIDKVIT